MDENILESILFGCPESSDNAIVINYCILYAKQYIYLEKLNDKKIKQNFKVDFLCYLSHLKNTLKIEKRICIKKNQKFKFDKFKGMEHVPNIFISFDKYLFLELIKILI